ncbi:MAG: PhzF family phenazine biosynthesis protein [Rufibacter sp.]
MEVHIMNAFTDNGIGGNPAGVVLNADSLSSEDKLAIAAKVGLSETAFVSRSALADFKLDFFTPTRQIAHCGHATIATFSYLRQQGTIKGEHYSKETIEGRREIIMQGKMAFMEQTSPRYIESSAWEKEILASLALQKSDLLPGAPIKVVNTGNSFAIIPVANTQILANIIPDFPLIQKVSEALDLIGLYVFSLEAEGEGSDATTRMFAPRYGIGEEAATGMAAGPLAGYLYDVLQQKKKQYLIQQGHFMQAPSPSLLTVEVQEKNGVIAQILVGGLGAWVRKITVEI